MMSGYDFLKSILTPSTAAVSTRTSDVQSVIDGCVPTNTCPVSMTLSVGRQEEHLVHRKLYYRRRPDRATRCVSGVEILPLLHNRVGTTCTTSSEQIEVMKLEGYSRPTYNKLAHSATTRSTVVGVIHKPTVDVDNTCTHTTCCGEIF